MTDKIQKKLILARKTISNLNEEEMKDLNGGATSGCSTSFIGCYTVNCLTKTNCPSQCQPWTCQTDHC